MPYIKREDRPAVMPSSERPAANEGELNFQISTLVARYVQTHGVSYATFNAIVGALVCAKGEFERRVVAPYEDEKRGLNGDVYQDVLETMRQLYRGDG